MPKASTLSIQDWALLAGIVALGSLLRIACASLLTSPLVSDYLVYWQLATNLHSGLGLIDEAGNPTAFMNLGYPIFLAGVFEIFGHSIAAVKGSNIGLASLSMLLLFSATHRLFDSVRISMITTLIFAVYLEGIVYTAYIAKENLMIFLMLLQLWIVTDKNLRRNNWINPILFGLTVGLTALVGNAALSLMPAMIMLICLRSTGLFSSLRYFLITFIVCIAMLMPLLIRNHEIFGSYVLNNNGGFNLYIGNNPNSTPFFMSITETPLGPQWQELHASLGEHRVDVLMRRAALDYIFSNAGTTLTRMAQKAIAFWYPPTHAGQGRESTVDYIVRMLWLIQFILACILFLASAAGLKKYFRTIGPIWLAIAGYTAIHMIFYVVYRYRLPIMPFVFIGAAFSVSAAISSWSMSRNGTSFKDGTALPSNIFGHGGAIAPKQVK